MGRYANSRAGEPTAAGEPQMIHYTTEVVRFFRATTKNVLRLGVLMRKSGAFFGSTRIAGSLSLLWLAGAPGLALGQAASHTGPLDKLVDAYCVNCHNAEDWAGSLALDTLDLQNVGEEPDVWETAIGKLRGRLMPPAGQKQPAQADVDAVVRFLETSLDTAAPEGRVGHVPIQRLSRIEFAE